MAEERCVVGITGASGAIGTVITEALSRHFRIVGLDRPGPPHPPPVADCVPLDVSSRESTEDALARLREEYGDCIHAIIHLAAYYSFSDPESEKYEEINVRGTERLLHALRDFRVEQFVYASSMLVHAPTEPGRPMDEDWPVDPKWGYPKSKLAAERIIREQRGDMPTVLLRMAGMYTDRCHAPLLAHQIRRIYEKEWLSHFFAGDPSHGQSWLHIEDLVDAVSRLVQRRHDLPRELPLLLGELETESYLTLQHEFGRLIHGEPWRTQALPKPLAKLGAQALSVMPKLGDPFIQPWMIELADNHYELNIDRARRLLDWEPKHRLRDALPRMIEALKRDPRQWYEENHLDQG